MQSVGMAGKADGVHAAARFGILPLNQKLTFDLSLIGGGEQHELCGSFLHFKKLGCLDVKAHNQSLKPDHHGKIAVLIRKYSCHRPDCPICHPDWVQRTKESAIHRIKHYSRHVQQSPIHVTLSPPVEALKQHKTLNGLFRKAKEICAAYDIPDGSLVYHSKSRICNHCNEPMPPRKNRCPKCGGWGWRWEFNPHFHFFGFGWLKDWYKGGRELYNKYGWVVKNLRIRKSIAGTVWYELSHCAYLGNKKKHIRWIGGIQSKTFNCPKRPEKDKPRCPICNQIMRPVGYCGKTKLPEIDEPQIIEASNEWYYKDETPPDIAYQQYEAAFAAYEKSFKE